MKSFNQLLEFLIEELSAINITNPDIQQKMKDAMANHDSATVLSLFKQYAGKANPLNLKMVIPILIILDIVKNLNILDQHP